MPAPLFPSRPRPSPRLLAGLIALAALGACDAPADKPAPPEEPAGEVAALSFEALVFVESTANNITVLGRVQHETRSAFAALAKRHIVVSQKKQVDVDLKRLSRERITVVDPVTKASRPALRVRYRFTGLAVVPKELAEQGEALLGLLHRDDAPHLRDVLETCVAPGDRNGETAANPWKAFDPSLPACAQAIEAEQQAIDAARAGLERPDTEIVPAELERVYLPVLLRIRGRSSRARPDAGASAARTHGAGSSGSGPSSGKSGGSGEPDFDGPAHGGPPGPKSSDDPVMDPLEVIARLRLKRLHDEAKKQDKDDDADDEEEAAALARATGAKPLALDDSVAGAQSPGGGAHEVKPLNYALLWFALAAIILLLGNELRRRVRRRVRRR